MSGSSSVHVVPLYNSVFKELIINSCLYYSEGNYAQLVPRVLIMREDLNRLEILRNLRFNCETMELFTPSLAGSRVEVVTKVKFEQDALYLLIAQLFHSRFITPEGLRSLALPAWQYDYSIMISKTLRDQITFEQEKCLVNYLNMVASVVKPQVLDRGILKESVKLAATLEKKYPNLADFSRHFAGSIVRKAENEPFCPVISSAFDSTTVGKMIQEYYSIAQVVNGSACLEGVLLPIEGFLPSLKAQGAVVMKWIESD